MPACICLSRVASRDTKRAAAVKYWNKSVW